jgi:hypothetical protein
MIRVVRVLWNTSHSSVTMVVLLFADVVVLLAMQFVPVPMMSLMGGVRVSPSEAVIASTAMTAIMFGVLSMPVWFLGSIISMWCDTWAWPAWRSLVQARHPVERSAWIAGAGLLVAGVCLLPVAQGEQRRRNEAETLLRTGELREAVRRMAVHERADYPPHWDPPPRFGRRERTPNVLDVLEAVAAERGPDWVWELFLAKIPEQIERETWAGRFHPDGIAVESNAQTVERWMAVLDAMPNTQQQLRASWLHDSFADAAKHLASNNEPTLAEKIRQWLIRQGVQLDEKGDVVRRREP